MHLKFDPPGFEPMISRAWQLTFHVPEMSILTTAPPGASSRPPKGLMWHFKPTPIFILLLNFTAPPSGGRHATVTTKPTRSQVPKRTQINVVLCLRQWSYRRCFHPCLCVWISQILMNRFLWNLLWMIITRDISPSNLILRVHSKLHSRP